MKVIPKAINSFIATPNGSDVLLNINESFKVKYITTDRSNNEILQDLIEAKAYATSLLYLNENYKLDKSSLNEQRIEDYYNDCIELLSKNVKVVEEKGIPLVSINGYNIYESDVGILRGNGKKKLQEFFKDEKDYSNYGKKQFDKFCKKYELDPKDLDNVLWTIDDVEGMFGDQNGDLQMIREYIYNNLMESEGTEGTQVDDIAPKLDQNMNGESKKKEKKYYDILLSGLDESMDSILNKGFTKNLQGQYERDGYILIKENNKFIAVRKDKLLK